MNVFDYLICRCRGKYSVAQVILRDIIEKWNIRNKRNNNDFTAHYLNKILSEFDRLLKIKFRNYIKIRKLFYSQVQHVFKKIFETVSYLDYWSVGSINFSMCKTSVFDNFKMWVQGQLFCCVGITLFAKLERHNRGGINGGEQK